LFVGGLAVQTKHVKKACVWAISFEEHATALCSITLESCFEVSLMERVPALDVFFAACGDEVFIVSFSGMSLDLLSKISLRNELKSIGSLHFICDSLYCQNGENEEFIEIHFNRLASILQKKHRRLEDPKEIINYLDDYVLKTFSLPQSKLRLTSLQLELSQH
jgi:hypothetical protein